MTLCDEQNLCEASIFLNFKKIIKTLNVSLHSFRIFEFILERVPSFKATKIGEKKDLFRTLIIFFFQILKIRSTSRRLIYRDES